MRVCFDSFLEVYLVFSIGGLFGFVGEYFGWDDFVMMGISVFVVVYF